MTTAQAEAVNTRDVTAAFSMFDAEHPDANRAVVPQDRGGASVTTTTAPERMVCVTDRGQHVVFTGDPTTCHRNAARMFGRRGWQDAARDSGATCPDGCCGFVGPSIIS